MLKQKKKSKPGGLLIKHLLDVTQKRKPATGEVVQSEEEKTKNKKFYVQAGAGIVADSKPIKEYEETVNKAKALISALK